MAHIEKTVFISYRRKDISWALAVYQYLTSQKYDVFFDYTSLQSGDFEEVIVSNIRARAHFLLILTPTALDRCHEPGDWLRREIETAVDEKRNIIPLFFDGFSFGAPGVAEKLSGKLSAINRYNGLEVPPGYFLEAMERLKNRYLNIPLDAVIRPVPTQVRKVVQETQEAANWAVEEHKDDLQKLVRTTGDKSEVPEGNYPGEPVVSSHVRVSAGSRRDQNQNLRFYGIGAVILLVLGLVLFRIDLGDQHSETSRTIPLTPETVVAKPSDTTSVSPESGLDQITIPEGVFLMGSKGHDLDEWPVLEVYLNAFRIDKTEVTNEMYKLCVKDRKCVEPRNHADYDNPLYSNHPVVYVTWTDAKNYCAWKGRRLPTEAEWEKAASWNERTHQKFVYPWGNEEPSCKLTNYKGDTEGCIGHTSSVGSYPAGNSPYGVEDMAGNVWEWVNDQYDMNYYESLRSTPAPITNPQGPDQETLYVFRGGSWRDTARDLRSANRGRGKDNDKSTIDELGFRCASSP